MRVDLELIVSILTRDEKLHVVVLVDRIVLLGELGRDVGLLDSVANVQIALIPKDRNLRLQMGRLATDKIDEAFGNTHAIPTRLIELAIDAHRFADLLCLDLSNRCGFNRWEANGLLGQPPSPLKHQRQRDCDDPDRPKATNKHLHTIPINPWCIRQRVPGRLVAIITYRSYRSENGSLIANGSGQTPKSSARASCARTQRSLNPSHCATPLA